MKKIVTFLLILTLCFCKESSDKFGTNIAANKSEEFSIKFLNNEIIQCLNDKDYKKFSKFIHPEKGIRFSMHGLIDLDKDLHFTKSGFEKYIPTKTLFIWGYYDGSESEYFQTIRGYLQQWVLARDFLRSEYSYNEFITNNPFNNLKNIYPGTIFTENYFKGTEGNEQLDWRALRFVFEKFQNKYYLVAVINDQWEYNWLYFAN